MSKHDECDVLEEIEEDAAEVKEPVLKKVIIKDKKLKIVLPEKDDDDEEEQVLKKVIIKKKSILVKPSEEHEDEDTVIEKPKAKRTQKQIDAFEKVRQKKMDNAKLREKERQKLALAEQKVLEEKIIKKALSIKKKQIKKESVLEEISDDETPIEVIKEMKANAKQVKPVETKPVKVVSKYNFL